MRSGSGKSRGLARFWRGALFFWFIFTSLSMFLPAQSVRFVKAIDFKKVQEKKSLRTFFFGRKEQPVLKPGSLCFLSDQLLAVTDAVNGAVVILQRNGAIKKRIARVKGERLISPVSCCGDDAGNFYISDSARGAVLQLDKKYKFKKIFIAHPGSRITGIFFANGVFYCVDTRGHRILCFDRGGELIQTIGKRGTRTGEFNFPTHITGDNRYLYITDAMNFRVQVFERNGEFVRTIGKMGRGGGNFSRPKGLAVDNERRIYAADAIFDNIQIFNFDGEFLYYFGGPGHGSGEFWMPSDVLVDADHSIWVADTYNSRIQVFKLEKESP